MFLKPAGMDDVMAENAQLTQKENVWNIPVFLTISRFALSPVFFLLILINRLDLALVTFTFVAATDFADGWIARSTKKSTVFGKMLDPMADKFMIFLALLALVLRFDFPLWGLFLVLSRDVVSLLGSLIVYVKYKGVWSANVFGKITTFLQIALVLFYLLDMPFKYWVLWATAAFSIVTAAIYLHRNIRIVSDIR